MKYYLLTIEQKDEIEGMKITESSIVKCKPFKDRFLIGEDVLDVINILDKKELTVISVDEIKKENNKNSLIK